MNYYAFCSADGVVQFVSAIQESEAPVPPAGMLVMRLDAPLTFGPHRRDGAAVVPYQPDPPAALPTQDWVWSDESKTWEGRKNLIGEKADRWTAIKLARATAINAPLPTPFGTFDSGPDGRTNISNAAQMMSVLKLAGNVPNITFTLADNTAITLTADNMISVGLLLGAKVQTAHSTGRALRVQIDAATTTTELEAIQWP
jgi:hypothetical protein